MGEPVWFYRSAAGTRTGPLATHDLCGMFAGVKLPLETQVYCAAAGAWVPASAIPGFRDAALAAAGARTTMTTAPAPAPAPANEVTGAPGEPAASTAAQGTPTTARVVSDRDPFVESGAETPRPWVRYFARFIDVALFHGVVAALLGAAYVLGVRPGWAVALTSVVVSWAGWPFAEALVLSAFGTTAGKALLGVSVRTAAGHRLSFPRALARSLGAWVVGQGMGIPVISMVAMWGAYKRLREEGTTPWDRDGSLTVRHDECGPARVIGGLIAAAVATGILMAIGATLEQSARPVPAIAKVAPTRIDVRPASPSPGAPSEVATAKARHVSVRPLRPAPGTIVVAAGHAPRPDAQRRQQVIGTWVAATSASAGAQSVALRNTFTLDEDGRFTHGLQATDPGGADLPAYARTWSGTWELAGDRLIEHVRASSTDRYPAGRWEFQLLTAGGSAMTLRRTLAPPGYEHAGKHPVLSYRRIVSEARVE